MTRKEILAAFRTWDADPVQTLRFGQWFLNRYHPDMAWSEVYYCENAKKALNMILWDSRTCSETYK